MTAGGPADGGWVVTVYTVVEDPRVRHGIGTRAIEDATFNTKADAERWARRWERAGYLVKVTNDV